MDKYVSTLKNNILQSILDIERMDCSVLQKSKLIIPQLEREFEELKNFIAKYSFKEESEEIYFFKELKPQLLSLLVYQTRVYRIEMRMPAGSIEEQKKYLMKSQDYINYFFDMNTDFYQYYRSGSTHLDHFYFLRKKPDIGQILDNFHMERDTNFSTCYDFKVTEILANDMLATYINSKLAELDQSQNGFVNETPVPKVKVTWTGKKTELVEQIYAWIEAECFNSGNISIKDLVEYIEFVFNIDLGDYYHVFIEMRERVGSRTIFLDKLIKFLNKRMDDADRI
ncbi:RteC domain-containing protein [Bacteroides sp. 519]|uniref:RteC domain-containing protein n=1 Tax=Bacteroides sp. 519 TaxID=2302937 RepID=UPI0013D64EB3|nr:RteC domain-containing protein [Bacteroides sp. 519]NDV60737.1 hypothetical protein [Bacteroides sp. 519]